MTAATVACLGVIAGAMIGLLLDGRRHHRRTRRPAPPPPAEAELDGLPTAVRCRIAHLEHTIAAQAAMLDQITKERAS